MRLTDLIGGEATVSDPGLAERTRIAGITSDSRRVEAGWLFAALPGARADGRMFIGDALARGASALLVPPDTDLSSGNHLPLVVIDPSPRRCYALMAARLHAPQPPVIAAVTGTNGKTSTVVFLRQIWMSLGRKAASLGTLGVSAPNGEHPGSLTTPDPADLHRTLHDLARQGVECVAMEASSHGLDQCRLDGVRVAAAAFTNLSRDHLDYHGTMARYLEAKRRLFTQVMAPGGVAVLNADAPECASLIEACRAQGHQVIRFGLSAGEIVCRKRAPDAGGTALELEVLGHRLSLRLPLIGDFQVANALTALGLALGLGADVEAATHALSSLAGAPGRLQAVGRKRNGAGVFVDYAHTPDGLAVVLGALRPHAAGRLVVVFGCGGDRDPGKRPEMGAIASSLADRVVVTDDNPRSENPASIRRQILAAAPDAVEIGDRAAAIRAAMADLEAGDVLVIAGKGHERGQIVGNTVLPFDDREVAANALREVDG